MRVGSAGSVFFRWMVALACAWAGAALAATPTVAAGQDHSVALKSDGSLWSWGSNARGQLGLGTTVDSAAPLRIGTEHDWSTLASGTTHTMAIKSNGTLWAWGWNDSGELGDGSTTRRDAPVQVGSDTHWTAVSGGWSHTLALKGDGTLWAWGANKQGQLGTGTGSLSANPVQVGLSSAWRSIASGAYHNLAVKSDGTLWSWGWNSDGQLGTGSYSDSTVPVQVGLANNWKTVAAGYAYSLAVKTDGSLWAWGLNGSGQLGTGAGAGSSVPLQVGTDRNWLLPIAGMNTSVAIKSDRSLWVWGDNSSGQAGNGSRTDLSAPVQVAGDAVWASAAAGYGHVLALKVDGTLWASGSNWAGELGIGGHADQSIPIPVGFPVANRTMAIGSYHALYIGSDGRLWAWGSNFNGELGNGALYATGSSNPGQVGVDADWKSVAAGQKFSLAIKGDGTLWGFGLNGNGQLGVPSVYFSTSPIQVGLKRSNWTAVSAGVMHAAALAGDGSLWTWGYNVVGQLGIGTSADAYNPVRVGTDSDWVAVSAGDWHTVALKRDGSLWAWGANDAGQVGSGASTGSNAPVRVGYGNNWIAVAAGSSHTQALQSDGSLWTWGGNSAGQLGLGTFTPSSTPARVGVENNWASIAAGKDNSVAIKRDGSLWAWGDASEGQLPGGPTVNSPVALGAGSYWLEAAAGGAELAAIPTSGRLMTLGALGSVTASSAATLVRGFFNANGGLRLDVTSGAGGMVVSSPVAINCGASCTALLDQGAVLSLSAIPQKGYAFSGWAGGCSAINGNVCTVSMDAAVGISASFADNQPPATPPGLTAIALSDTQVSLAWSAATDNAAVVSYKVFRSGVLISTLGQVLGTMDTGLAPGTGYLYQVMACDLGGNCSALSTPVAVTTAGASASGYAAFIAPGWNLLGNGFATALNVASTFGNQDAPVAGITPNVVSLWKWNAAASRWAFYSPQLSVAANASYVAAHGYDLLATVNAREGYWIQTGATLILPAQGGAKANFGFTEFSALPAGFNLLSLSQKMSPTAFNNGVAQASPPSPSAPIQSNFTSLWAWDPAQQGWLFYAPSLEAGGGLAAVKAYALSKGYGHFQDQARSLDLGQGFWVSK